MNTAFEVYRSSKMRLQKEVAKNADRRTVARLSEAVERAQKEWLARAESYRHAIPGFQAEGCASSKLQGIEENIADAVGHPSVISNFWTWPI